MGRIHGVKLVVVFVCLLARSLFASDLRITDENPLQLPVPGAYNLRILSPTLLELTLITTKLPDPAVGGGDNVARRSAAFFGDEFHR